ncbi:hypothetical protein CTM94_10210 [Photobacterium leiognathi]|uniref:Uncharacterized protein n=1 Tax=Photobacterium leiognathi TaxID=553611 RepID=A0ABX5GGE5_PHOLE|nr:hypothetical protein [Photobacterium leiognathi]KJF89788.1 hypothetical protein UB42_11055 [Photobacterium leiognathi]PSV82514.1 hypothetical protein CTM94_10210 [Photobacterium leiognathi]
MKIFVIISFFTLSVFSSLAHASGGGSAGANGGNGAQSVPIYRCVYTDRNGQQQDVFVPQYFCDSNGGKTIL